MNEMLKVTSVRTSQALSLLWFIAVVTSGCGSVPEVKRPQNVPSGATYALGNKGVGGGTIVTSKRRIIEPIARFGMAVGSSSMRVSFYLTTGCLLRPAI